MAKAKPGTVEKKGKSRIDTVLDTIEEKFGEGMMMKLGDVNKVDGVLWQDDAYAPHRRQCPKARWGGSVCRCGARPRS